MFASLAFVILGTIHDPAGLAVPAAEVRVTNAATRVGRTVVSDANGGYQVLGLPPGVYRVAVSKDGFAPLERDGLALRVGDRITLDLTLELGPQSEAVVVTGEGPLLQQTRGTASYVVEQRRVVTLPLDGRNFVPLIALAPGVNLPPGNLLPRINGSRPRVSEYLYDGISVLQPEPGQVAFYPVIDAIEEFRVETNSFPAEYGRANGGVILVNQKSGGNALHGTLFEYFRHEKLNARNLFAGAGGKPQFRRNQYGFVLGGPVQRNKTLFFSDWQGTRLGTGAVRTSTVPTMAQRQGVFARAVYDPATTRRTADGWARDPFPDGKIPEARFDREAVATMARYPLPLTGGVANNYSRLASDHTAADQFDGRVDRYFGAMQRVFVRYSYLRDESAPASLLPDGVTTGRTRASSLAAEHTWNVSNAAVNQLRAGYSRRSFRRTSAGLPGYDLAGLQSLGPGVNTNANFSTAVTQVVESFSVVRGRHTIKTGVDLRLQALNVLEPSNPHGQGQFTPIFTSGLKASGAALAGTGDSFASFLLGQASSFSIDSQADALQPRATIAEGYVQDDWRVSRRLSLNPGVRYTLNFPSTVAGDRGAVFNLDTQRLDFLGRNGYPRSARELEKTNFAPRAGLAFKLTDSLVVRSAYGLTWIEQAGITTPFTTPMFPFVQTLSRQSADNIQPAYVLADGPRLVPRALTPDAGVGQGVFAVQRDNGSGYAQQWNFTLQKTFGEQWSVSVGYLGSKLTRLGLPDVNLNQLTIEQVRAGSFERPYPRFQTVTLYRNNVGHLTYHSAQAHLEKRFSAGMTFTAAYTFSRLIDDAGAVFDSAVLTGPVLNFQAADSFNRRLEKDVSTGNIPHIVAAGIIQELPRGWQAAAIVRMQSGSPLAVMQATNFNSFAGFGMQRPNRIAGAGLEAGERSTARWFNTAAFTLAPQGAIGTSSRNPVTGPGYRTLDVMIGKTFVAGERLRTEFRAEAFNVTNTPLLGSPNRSFGSAAFGSITTALDPRVFELVLRMRF